MITIFSIPKPFEGHLGRIQRNAVRSWRALSDQVFLFGDEPGTAEACASTGAEHVPSIQRNDYGTPLLNGVFDAAQARSRFPVLCYANADIIFLDGILDAAENAVRRFGTGFLMAGRRTNLDFDREIEFDDGSRSELRDMVARQGRLQDVWWIDYFVFPNGGVAEMPPFAVGRAGWDNWMVSDALVRGLPVIDCTRDVMAVHQNHDYRHVRAETGSWTGPESERNVSLAGGERCLYSLADATHSLSRGRFRRRLPFQALRRTLGLERGLRAALFPDRR